MKRVKQGLSLMMTLMLGVSCFTFSLTVNAKETASARIIGFNPLGENIETQNLCLGASIDDVVLPESIKALVEVTEDIAEDSTNEESEKSDTFTTEETTESEESSKMTEEQKTGNDNVAPSDSNTSSDEEITETDEDAVAETEDEIIDTNDVNIQSQTMLGKTSEVTLENVTWKIAEGKEFDSSKEATYIFEAVFSTDYVIVAAIPTIKVNIVNAKDSQVKSVNVTFTVVNGYWDDETTADKTITLTVEDGDVLKLAKDQIPAVGSKPADSKYKTGSWNMIPSEENIITESITYTYTYAEKKAAVITKAPEARTLYYIGQTK